MALKGDVSHHWQSGQSSDWSGRGVFAVPMAACVANKVGLQANRQNFLLMHAMVPNVAGSIGSAVDAGVLLSVIG